MRMLMMRICVVLLRLIYLPFRFARTKNRIVFISRQSNKIPLDFLLIKKELEKHHPEITTIFLCRTLDGSIARYLGYVPHMIRQMRCIATSRLVVLDGYCILASIAKHKKNLRILQIWHASTAIKQFGYQVLDMKSGRSGKVAEIMHMHRNYDKVIAPSRATAKFYSEGFDIDLENIDILPMPHYDVLMESSERKIDDIQRKYPQLNENINVLYIPTLRKGEEICLGELTDRFDFSKYNLIVRLHPLSSADRKDDRAIYDTEFSTFDWMKMADIHISDYSSIIIESAMLNKPICFYAYDLDKYQRDPGFNIDMRKEALAGFICVEAKSLVNMIDEIADGKYDIGALSEFKNKYVESDCSESALAVAEYMVNMMQDI